MSIAHVQENLHFSLGCEKFHTLEHLYIFEFSIDLLTNFLACISTIQSASFAYAMGLMDNFQCWLAFLQMIKTHGQDLPEHAHKGRHKSSSFIAIDSEHAFSYIDRTRSSEFRTLSSQLYYAHANSSNQRHVSIKTRLSDCVQSRSEWAMLADNCPISIGLLVIFK